MQNINQQVNVNQDKDVCINQTHEINVLVGEEKYTIMFELEDDHHYAWFFNDDVAEYSLNSTNPKDIVDEFQRLFDPNLRVIVANYKFTESMIQEVHYGKYLFVFTASIGNVTVNELFINCYTDDTHYDTLIDFPKTNQIRHFAIDVLNKLDLINRSTTSPQSIDVKVKWEDRKGLFDICKTIVDEYEENVVKY